MQLVGSNEEDSQSMRGGRYVCRHGRQTAVAAVNRRSFTRALPWTRTTHFRPGHRQHHRRHDDDVTPRHHVTSGPTDTRQPLITSLLEQTVVVDSQYTECIDIRRREYRYLLLLVVDRSAAVASVSLTQL